MRKLVLGFALLFGSLSAGAQHVYQPGHNHGSYSYRGHVSTQHHGFYHGHRHHGHNGWIVPALIGGAVVYAVTRPPVIIQQPPVVVESSTPVVYIDGVAYTKQIMIIDGVQREVLVKVGS